MQTENTRVVPQSQQRRAPASGTNSPAKRTGPRTAITKRPRKETFTIAYRVDGAALRWLEEKAKPYQMSVHEYARERLTETILDAANDEMRSLLTEVRRDMSELREDLAVTLEIMLAHCSDADPVQIRAWVDDNLRKGR